MRRNVAGSSRSPRLGGGKREEEGEEERRRKTRELLNHALSVTG